MSQRTVLAAHQGSQDCIKHTIKILRNRLSHESQHNPGSTLVSSARICGICGKWCKVGTCCTTVTASSVQCSGGVKAGRVRPLKLPARSPNLNAFAERWVRSVKEECLSRLILFAENSLFKKRASFAPWYLTGSNVCTMSFLPA